MGRSILSPSARNGHENIRLLLNELRLLLWREHQVAIALLLRGERGEYFPLDTEVGRTHVRGFFSAWQAQSDPTKIRYVHAGGSLFQRRLSELYFRGHVGRHE